MSELTVAPKVPESQSHVLDAWPSLSDIQRQSLLHQIDQIDWPHVQALYQSLVVEKRAPISLPSTSWEPAVAVSHVPPEAREAGVEILRTTAQPLYGAIIVAGGSGSGFKFPHAKGLFPATPLRHVPLFDAWIEKIKAAARAYGHARMFPTVVMVSAETEQETRAYFEKRGYFGEADRLYFARQSVLPLLDRRPGQEGRVVMHSPFEIAMGGAGHGDAFDEVLKFGAPAYRWLDLLGVRYVHFMNVDNLLNPFGDVDFLGQHVLSEAARIPGRAHISVILIPKKVTRRMGNIIEYREGERRYQQSIDYGILPEVDDRCELGHASLQIVTLNTLQGTAPAPFMVAAKEVQVAGQWIPVWKFERSSNNKERDGALIRRESEDVFASIKKRTGDAPVETPKTAAQLISDHWKKRLPPGMPASSVVELPWDADFMSDADLQASLDRMGFPHHLNPFTGYAVMPRFDGFRETCVKPVDRDHQRVRAIIAEFNNHFEDEPDVLVKAPGRNTAIGDHQDYPALPQDGSARSLTIAWASQQNVLVAAKKRADHAVKLWSVNFRQSFTFSLDDLDGLAQEAARDNLPDVYGQPLYPWAMNVLALLFSARHGRQRVRTGLPLGGIELAFEGNVPLGAGQSSSAAFLVGITLACNDLFQWSIPSSDRYTLADIARSGEHEDYSPFIKRGKSGYLDQITSLSAVAGKAVVLNHGNYGDIRHIDLERVDRQGYCNVIVSSGLSRSLAETDYVTRVDELGRLPAVMNRLLKAADRRWSPKDNIHQFTAGEWRRIAALLDREDPTLGKRAHYIFEEGERTEAFIDALEHDNMAALLSLVQGSGDAMSMRGSYRISGYNQVPRGGKRLAALDTLREIVLRHAGAGAAARMVGGGGAGPLYVLLPRQKMEEPGFVDGILQEWYDLTGLTARMSVDPPAAGAAVCWRYQPDRLVTEVGNQRILTYPDPAGQTVYRLSDQESGMAAEIVPGRGTLRALTATIGGVSKAILFNPETKPDENGAAPFIGPWVNRVKNGQASFDGQEVDLLRVAGVRPDGLGNALHGLMTQGWHVDEQKTAIGPEGISLVIWNDTEDYTPDPAVRRLFGSARTEVTYRLEGPRIYLSSTTRHRGLAGGHRIPVLAAFHPWFLLDPYKHPYAEILIPARKRRLVWNKIPLPFLPAVSVGDGDYAFQKARRLGRRGYDVNYADLYATPPHPFPVAHLRDWFRDMSIRIGIVRGFDEMMLYRPANGANTVCLEPQIGSINALGVTAPLDARIPTIGPGESYRTEMFIEVAALSESGATSPFLAAAPYVYTAPSLRFPVLLSSGLETGPLAVPEKTATQKDAVRVFFRNQWHIYGTGHEMKDPANPPPGHRPHRGSILFHIRSDGQTGPYIEESPPVLLGGFPKGIYEAPSLVAEGDTLHLFAQTTYYQLGGTIEHFTSTDGHHFHWVGTALTSRPGTDQAGVYDADVTEIVVEGVRRKALVYSGFSRERGREDRPDPQVFIAFSDGDWKRPFQNGARPLLRDRDVPWHNAHDPANPFYEWGLEGAQLLSLPRGGFLLLSVAFEKRPSRQYMAAQRLLFARYDERLRLQEVSGPLLPLQPPWEEYGHGSMMIDDKNPNLLRLLYQARPGNEDRTFRDSNSWRLFEALFDLARLDR